jgi:glycopeptide antibiotics resistance protein
MVNMRSRLRSIRWFPFIVLIVYLGLLTKYIVFKRDSIRYYKHYFAREYKRYTVSKGWKKANTVPFRTIDMYYKGYKENNKSATFNLLGNLLGFIPFGILLPLALSWFVHPIRMLVAIVFLSLGFEVVQLLTGLGVFDIDDLLLNSSGAIGGFILFSIGRLLFRSSPG